MDSWLESILGWWVTGGSHCTPGIFVLVIETGIAPCQRSPCLHLSPQGESSNWSFDILLLALTHYFISSIFFYFYIRSMIQIQGTSDAYISLCCCEQIVSSMSIQLTSDIAPASADQWYALMSIYPRASLGRTVGLLVVVGCRVTIGN